MAEAKTDVSGASCRHCHEDLAALNAEAVGRDLHPIHDGITCTSCHAEDMHMVQAMSSAVDLQCADCHARAHGVSLGPERWPSAAVCGECHTGVHAAQQRLILGIRPDGSATPSAKFMAGITCRSCHVPPAGDSSRLSEPIRGQASACAGCHEAQYAQVLAWWIEGLETRLSETRAYVDRAVREIQAPPDSARALLEMSRRMVALVAEAGGQHNLELSDRLMREALDRAHSAYA
nr:hypothetical protein [Gemmatimonadota bacterium]NIQ57343.1 hypothetical protein [Gemmatimonadota bacterium]NIU77504.1 hypothetical protein [Gammaproteobacteria bacterium]NIX46714.1 hypothetical protein [Gemmatimonadota bacterium]NIY11062.1 hypothetical protein [Gemmatimonadota bacterium]